MSFGLDENGFSLKTIDDVLLAIRTKQQALFGAAFAAQLDTSAVGQLNGVYANEIADIWLLAQSIWRMRYPSTAEGVSLDYLGEETGAFRLAAERSTVDLTFSGTNGTVVPIGTIVQVTSTEARFVTTEEGTVSGGVVTVAAESEDFGPILGPAGEIDDLVTPVSGIASVTNALDADVGRDVETDAAFRIRRAALLRQQGEATTGAIRSDLLALDGVDEVRIFNNPTGSTNGDGVPAHSFEVVVRGGTNQAIFDEIFDSQPAGIQSYGTTSGTSLDENGDSQAVAFSRPTDIDIWADVAVTVDDNYPADGDDQIKQAIVDFWESFDQRIGKDVIVNAFFGVIYAIPGVVQVTSLTIDDVDPPVSTTTTVIGTREIAVFDTSRIDVLST